MKAVVNKNALLDALKRVASVKSGRMSLPILETTRFVGPDKEGYLTVMATNHEAFAEERVYCSSFEYTEILGNVETFCVDSKKITQIVKGCQGSNVTIETTYKEGKKSETTVKVDSAQFKADVCHAEAVAQWPVLNMDNIKSKAIGTLMMTPERRNIQSYATDDPLRPQMNGVLFDFENSALVACDGHVLNAMSADIVPAGDLKGVKNCIVFAFHYKNLPLGKMQVEYLVRVDKTKDYNGKEVENVYVKYAVFSKDNWKMTVICIEGRYPNWKAVIPSEYPVGGHITVKDNADFIKKMKQTITAPCVKLVRLSTRAGSNMLTLCSRDIDLDTTTTFEVELMDAATCDMVVGVNKPYAISICEKAGWDGDIYIADASRPIIFGCGLKNNVALAMPMLLGDSDLDDFKIDVPMGKEMKSFGRDWSKVTPDSVLSVETKTKTKTITKTKTKTITKTEAEVLEPRADGLMHEVHFAGGFWMFYAVAA